MPALEAIPTNMITGFLGVGKTTAILNLLKHKPNNERWAVLVNEFGEVGIDGSLFENSNNTDQGIYIREVPGGCMCCTSGLPMQIALNMLLSRAKPHRLLIEPTGLGHPKEVLDTLRSKHYRSVLNLQATLTLVDARKIQIKRYTEHDTFNQQLEIADVIVANKTDKYDTGDFPNLLSYLESKQWLDKAPVYQTRMGKVQADWLNGSCNYQAQSHVHHHALEAPMDNVFQNNATLPECGYLSICNQGEGFISQGWIFKPTLIFNRDKLYEILTGIEAERLKAVFITDQGVVAYNMADSVLTEIGIDDAADSRIECISMTKEPFNGLEARLLSCINV